MLTPRVTQPECKGIAMSIPEALLDRRAWFSLTGVALTSLLSHDGLLRASGVPGEASDPPPHHPPRARRVIHICLCGGMSHLDTFDHKPALAKFHGKKLPGSEKPETFFGQVGLLRPSAAPAEPGDPPPPHPPRARRVIHICLCGGMSHLDTFDHKPALAKFHGKKLPGSEKPETFFGQVGLLRQHDWAFRRRGKSGLWVSDLFPHIATVADELTVINSMVADSANHTPATFQENTGFRFNGFPVMGSWLSYGLGAETDELPAYVVLPDPRGLPAGSTINWSSGFLPARHQGVTLRTKGAPIDDLFPARPIAGNAESSSRDLLKSLNAMHTERAGASAVLAARVRSYELAARMQVAVPQVTDLSREPAAIRS